MATLELRAPVGLSLTTQLFPLGSDTQAGTVTLTERVNSVGVYRGAVADLTGWHLCQVYAGPLLVAFWYVRLADDDGVYYGQDRDAALWARFEAALPDAPALLIPPDPAGQTVAWALCYDAHGAPEAEVTVEIRLIERQVGGAGGAYEADATSGVSDVTGLVQIVIPRGDHLRFQVRRETGEWVAFSGVDDETMALPRVIG